MSDAHKNVPQNRDERVLLFACRGAFIESAVVAEAELIKFLPKANKKSVFIKKFIAQCHERTRVKTSESAGLTNAEISKIHISSLLGYEIMNFRSDRS